MSWIPLLSRHITEMSAVEFREHVRGLHMERVRKKYTRGPPKRLKLTSRILKSGAISLTTRRSPKYVTTEELTQLEKLLDRPANLIFIAATEGGFTIVRDHREADEIAGKLKALPW